MHYQHEDAAEEWARLKQWAWNAGAAGLMALSGLLVGLYVTATSKHLDDTARKLDATIAQVYDLKGQLATLGAAHSRLDQEHQRLETEQRTVCNRTRAC